MSSKPLSFRGAPFALAVALLTTSPALGSEPLSAHDVARIRTVGEVVISPAGDRIAYTLSVPRDPFEDEDGKAYEELHVADAAGESRPYITGKVNVDAVAWSPDGSAITFLARRGEEETDSLYALPVAGGEARRLLAHETDIEEYSWSPDGGSVAFLAAEKLSEELTELAEKGFDQEIFEEDLRYVRVWIHELEGESRRLDVEGSASELHWSPEGGRLAVALAPTPLIDDEYMKRRVHVVEVASGEISGVVETGGKIDQFAWSPDGGKLALIAGVDRHDPQAGRLMLAPGAGGRPRDLLPGYPGQVAKFAWRDADTLVFIGDRGTQTELAAVGLDGAQATDLAPDAGPVWRRLSLSRDGRRIALSGQTGRHPAELFRLDAGEAAATRLTDSNRWLAERTLAPQEVFEYPARDGLALQGILVRPLAGVAQGPAPLVLIVHGGPESHVRNGWVTSYSRPAQILAGMGIASFYPNYRGSTGRGVAFSKLSQGDPAGKEFDDLVDAVDALAGRGWIDSKRVGITGASYGGYATAWGSTYYSDRFAAGVMLVGISNEISKFGTSDIPNELNWVHLRSWPWENYQSSLERSPIYHVAKARTPLLILHGKKDTRVFPGQSMELHRALKTLGKTPVRLVLYPNEGHGNRRAAARLDYSLRSIRWFEHYLLGEGGEPPSFSVEYRRPADIPADEESP